jgi:hypothetical protein
MIVIGEVSNTITPFLQNGGTIGFISVDVDYYPQGADSPEDLGLVSGEISSEGGDVFRRPGI